MGQPPERAEEVIAAIAKVVSATATDICVIAEVMQTYRPPARPKIWPARDVVAKQEMFSGDDRVALEAASLEIYKRFNDQDSNVPANVLGHNIVALEFAAVATNQSLMRQEKIAAIYDKLSLDNSNLSWDLLQLRASVRFQEVRDLSIDAYMEWTVLPRGTVKADIEEYLDIDETVGSLFDEYLIEEWYDDFTKNGSELGLSDYGKKTKRAHDLIAEKMRNKFQDEIKREYASLVYRKDYDDVDDDDLTRSRRMFDAQMNKHQEANRREDRREKLYELRLRQWEETREKTEHPGLAQLHAVHAVLNDQSPSEEYGCWPVNAAPTSDTIDYGTTARTLGAHDLGDRVLFTKRETYGVLYRKTRLGCSDNVALTGVTRLSGYRKRAPYVFGFTFCGDPVNVIAWHAPSNAAGNATARGNDFAKFATLPKEVFDQTEAPTISVGDFNINTLAGDDIQNASGYTQTASKFFESLVGDSGYDTGSYYWNARTTLRRSVDRPDAPLADDYIVDEDAFTLTASAFDKIAPYLPSIEGWSVLAEMVLPSPYFLSEMETRSRMPALALNGDGGSPLTFPGTDLSGVGGILNDIGGVVPVPPLSYSRRLLWLARLLSDHQPLITVFGIPD